ncbi:MAG TPA: hypothetical protein VGP26_23550 [Actinophytocola sp.]|nr:hypothetical protein [Actinophytocola sp.]
MIGNTNQEMTLFTTAVVDSDVAISLHTHRLRTDSAVSLSFGDECVTLECYDVASLERLRDLADEGARRLRAALEACGGR